MGQRHPGMDAGGNPREQDPQDRFRLGKSNGSSQSGDALCPPPSNPRTVGRGGLPHKRGIRSHNSLASRGPGNLTNSTFPLPHLRILPAGGGGGRALPRRS
jgi:hypothetical protein